MDLRPFDRAKPDEPFAGHDEELLGLHVVVMVAAGDAGPRARDKDLPEPRRLDELGQAAAGVALDVQSVLRLRRLDVGEIGRVELLVEAAPRNRA